jgi:hypothetical protein
MMHRLTACQVFLVSAAAAAGTARWTLTFLRLVQRLGKCAGGQACIHKTKNPNSTSGDQNITVADNLGMADVVGTDR